MSLYSQPVFKIATDLGKVRMAAALGMRRSIESMTLGSLGKGAAIGAGATVARNVVQGRDTFEGIGGGAVMGAVGLHAYRAAWQGKQFLGRASNFASLVKSGKQGTAEYTKLFSHLRGDTARMRQPFFAK